VVAQYYTLLRLGFEGYRRVQQACRDTARGLAEAIGELGAFHLLTDGSQLPVLAFRKADGLAADWTVYEVADELRMRGWLVPAYPMPPALDDMTVLRVVVRNGFGPDLASLLAADMGRALETLSRRGRGDPAPHPSFHH
jgi:glutamate decarboxylase